MEGKEGNLNEERFIEEDIFMRPFYLQREREEGCSEVKLIIERKKRS